MSSLSNVESTFFNASKRVKWTTRIPYIIVPNFPNLGFLTALRFLEWAADNPEGVISLPTGKTPEHFIKWTRFLIENWQDKKIEALRNDNGLILDKKPDLKGLRFVQIDEFYPIDPAQQNSFYNYVCKYYIEGFGLDKERALLINSEEIPLADGKAFGEVFPDSRIDVSLRSREAQDPLEEVQRASLFMIDNWCTRYEERIREMGGIGFFLGGIGPDGHIAFNVRGSDHNSTTRLTPTNFETQAAAAGDLGGIEVSRNRLVITIGLSTITSDPDGVSIIFAAGEAKARVVKNALESAPNNLFPATVLQRQQNARFYLTEGAAVGLTDSIESWYSEGEWTFQKTTRAVYDLCERIDKFAHNLELADLQEDRYCSMIPDLSLERVKEVISATEEKIRRGLQREKDQVYLHTGPHHDDVQLGIFPNIIRQLREPTNDFNFAVLTSGFTAVSNHTIREMLSSLLHMIRQGRIEMLNYPDFFEKGYKEKWDKDIAQFLDSTARKDEDGKLRGVCHRLTRAVVEIHHVKSVKELKEKIKEAIHYFDNCYDGEKNPQDIQTLKGMLREFEEELIWGHYGVRTEKISHLRLGFYTGDIFTPLPERDRDVKPILAMLKELKPTVISLAFDPEGSGPDTHYKVLQAIAEALRQWQKEADLSKLRIIGYRNVWFRFQPSEAEVFTPVSLNSMAVLDSSFKDCYISQVKASFPSHEYDGPFSDLSQRVWVEQFRKVQLVLGKDWFYNNPSPKVRATHGMIFHREMDLEEFLGHARALEQSMEGAVIL